MKAMRVAIVTGSRHYDDPVEVGSALAGFDPDLIIEGGAPGADTYARAWAERHGVARLTWPDEHWGGHVTGPTRNRRMCVVAKALAVDGWEARVLAFPLRGSRGTWSCVNQARAAGLAVEVHGKEAS